MQDSAISGWNAPLEHWNEAVFLALNLKLLFDTFAGVA